MMPIARKTDEPEIILAIEETRKAIDADDKTKALAELERVRMMVEKLVESVGAIFEL